MYDAFSTGFFVSLLVMVIFAIFFFLFADSGSGDYESEYFSDERTTVLKHYPDGRVRTESYYDFREDEDD